MPDHPEEEVLSLIARTAITFTGTVQRLGMQSAKTAELAGVPPDDHTAVVHVNQLLHAPPPLSKLAGHDVIVQLASGAELPQPGTQAAFFTDPVAFGTTVAVTEVGRLPVTAVQPYVQAAMEASLTPSESFARQLANRVLRSHAADADEVVVGTVAALERAEPPRSSEHDPHWWRATLDVHHVEQGNLTPGQTPVLYANSDDVRWRSSPKPKPGQQGLWLLHATTEQFDDKFSSSELARLRSLGPYVIYHPEDYQPPDNLNRLRAGDSPQ